MTWRCKNCGFTWKFPVETCIKCNVGVEVYLPQNYVVKGITEVLARSVEHNEVPYYVLLLEDNNGLLSLRKSFQKFEIGHEIAEVSVRVDLPKIGIVGTGVTGVGITQIALMSGCKVVLCGRSENSLYSAVERIEKALSKRLPMKKIKSMMDSITLTTNMSELSDANIIIEAVPENIDVKHLVFKELDSICNDYTILATNTSSISIDGIAKATNHPERVIGMHFFNPIQKMRLVEIVLGSKTNQSTIEYTKKTAIVFNKTPVLVKNNPGFIVNRLLMLFLNEAVQLLEENLATKEDIDTAIELGLNHPMGPLKLLDLIGIDIFHDIMANLRNYQPEKFSIPLIIREMKDNKKLGRKTREGFYSY